MAAIIPCDKCIHGKVCAMGFQFRRETANVTIVCKDIVRKTDVAPRAEVEYWKEQCFHACMNNGCLDKAIVKAAVAREIFEEIEKLHLHITNDFDARRYEELKKKYADGKK